MSIVSKFIIDEKTIEIADKTARTSASSANTLASKAQEIANAAKNASNTNTSDITKLKALPRLTASYSENTETIEFTNGTHSI